MDMKRLKYESPARLAELKPDQTLRRIGLADGRTVCDIGAGSGVFTFPAAQITRSTVYALDINADMLALIREKARDEGCANVQTIAVTGDDFRLPPRSVDIVLMSAVLHEIEDKAAFLTRARALLKDGGKIAVIEFFNRPTPMGPKATQRRLGKDELLETAAGCGLALSDTFDLGENFYCAVLAAAGGNMKKSVTIILSAILVLILASCSPLHSDNLRIDFKPDKSSNYGYAAAVYEDRIYYVSNELGDAGVYSMALDGSDIRMELLS